METVSADPMFHVFVDNGLCTVLFLKEGKLLRSVFISRIDERDHFNRFGPKGKGMQQIKTVKIRISPLTSRSYSCLCD